MCPTCGTVYPWAVWKCSRDHARLVERSEDLVGQQLDHYRVLEELGRGGCGRIYRALPTYCSQPVALKVLHPGADATLIERFRREAQAMRRVKHPNVVACLDHGTSADGRDFIVMEHVRGHVLTAELRSKKPLDPMRAARIVREVALALHAVHKVGLVHRDVKPDNVMISHEGRVKLIDFGIARDVSTPAEAQLTSAGRISGTPRYLAPEVFEGGVPDARSDLYALGVMLYELLTGSVPFDGSLVEVASAHLTSAPAPIPGAVGAAALALLAKDPAERPQSARAVVAYLDALIERLRMPAAPVHTLADHERLSFTPAIAPSRTPVPGAVPAHPVPAAPARPVTRSRWGFAA